MSEKSVSLFRLVQSYLLHSCCNPETILNNLIYIRKEWKQKQGSDVTGNEKRNKCQKPS